MLDIIFININKAPYKLTGYLKIVFIKPANFVIIKMFIKNYILYRYNIPIRLKVNKTWENKKQIVKAYLTLHIFRLTKLTYILYR